MTVRPDRKGSDDLIYCTVTWTVELWVRLPPEVPVTVSVYVPAGVPEGGFTVSEAVLVTPA